MNGFREWLLFTEARQTIDPAVVQSYERAFRDGLEGLIQRSANNAPLKKTLETMRQCPIKTASGCTGWTDYIVGGLLRHCSQTVDLDASLSYVAFRMLSPVGERGQPRQPLFDMDPNREYNVDVGNPLAARFKTFLMHDLKSICGGKVRRLMLNPNRVPTVTIMPSAKGQEPGTVSAGEIPDPSDTEEYKALLRDIMSLLQKQSTDDLPLADLFLSILRGEGTRVQRQRFGHSTADRARKVIYQVIDGYAEKTGNLALRSLLQKCRDHAPDPNAKRSRHREKQVSPLAQLPPDTRDYISILQVIQAAGGAASSAVLGKKRARWYERKPRNPASPHPTRLHDVLACMVTHGVLEKHGATYILGPDAEKYTRLAQNAETVSV
jgi:hypothetical protein